MISSFQKNCPRGQRLQANLDANQHRKNTPLRLFFWCPLPFPYVGPNCNYQITIFNKNLVSCVIISNFRNVMKGEVTFCFFRDACKFAWLAGLLSWTDSKQWSNSRVSRRKQKLTLLVKVSLQESDLLAHVL